jgi:hypothetical protein
MGIIRELTERALWEVKNVIDCIPEEMWEKNYCEMPVWKHVYHMLHSLDQWYINPNCYEEPDFHKPDLNNLDAVSNDSLNRKTINRYYEAVSSRIKSYDTSLIDTELLKNPENCSWTRFTLILSQYRHLHSHMGILMGFIIEDTGRWPRVLGLMKEFPKGEYDSFF